MSKDRTLRDIASQIEEEIAFRSDAQKNSAINDAILKVTLGELSNEQFKSTITDLKLVLTVPSFIAFCNLLRR